MSPVKIENGTQWFCKKVVTQPYAFNGKNFVAKKSLVVGKIGKFFSVRSEDGSYLGSGKTLKEVESIIVRSALVA